MGVRTYANTPKEPGIDLGDTAVAITSANALRHAPKDLLAALRDLPCFVVGGTTAAQARKAGFANVREGPGTAEGLASDVIADAATHAVLLLCGRVRLSNVEQRLAEAGIAVRALETYDTLPVRYAPKALSALLGKEPIDAVLLYSGGAAASLLRRQWPQGDTFATTKFLCLSQRVADRLGSVDGRHILVAEEPTEDALFARLES